MLGDFININPPSMEMTQHNNTVLSINKKGRGGVWLMYL